MKYIISESRIKSFIIKYLIDNLGSFKNSSEIEKNIYGNLGTFHDHKGKRMGVIRMKSFWIDENLYFRIIDMFDMWRDTLDEYIIEIMDEMGYEIKEVVLINQVH